MIPASPGKGGARRRVMAAALPSSASMLSDLRSALINQVALVKRAACERQFDAKEIDSLKTLISAVQLLDANTARVADDVAAIVEDMTPEQLAAAEAEARRLLAGDASPNAGDGE